MSYTFTIIGKNIEITDAIRESVAEKTEKIKSNLKARELLGDISFVVRTYGSGKKGQKAEITVLTKFGLIKAESVEKSLYKALDKACDKVIKRIKKEKEMIVSNKRHNKSGLSKNIADTLAENESKKNKDYRIVKTKTFPLETMDAVTAIHNMKMLGHSFYFYRDEETGEAAIVYERKEDQFGQIIGINY